MDGNLPREVITLEPSSSSCVHDAATAVRSQREYAHEQHRVISSAERREKTKRQQRQFGRIFPSLSLHLGLLVF